MPPISPECAPYSETLKDRSMLVKKATPLPVECIVRGYLSGSSWKDYRHNQCVSGIKLPADLKESCKLPQTIFTPTTKAPEGQHDSPITRAEMEDLIGKDLTEKIIQISLAIYERAASMALNAGIIIADTKMEFGLMGKDLILIDELLTPTRLVSGRLMITKKAGHKAVLTNSFYAIICFPLTGTKSRRCPIYLRISSKKPRQNMKKRLPAW